MKIDIIMNTHITQIINKVKQSDKKTYVIGIAGGSASGKSWLSDLLCKELRNCDFDCVIMHQDDFAIGKGFKDKHTSLYKWDDPANFRLDEAYSVAESVLIGQKASFLAYTLRSHMPTQSTQIGFKGLASQKKVLIIEGLFAWSQGFEKLVNEKIFMQANFFHSFVLRLNRNITEQKVADFETVVNQYFTHVAKAYLDLCLPMKRTADLVIKNDVNPSMLEAPKKLTYQGPMPESKMVYHDNTMIIRLANHEADYLIEIANPRGILFREFISSSIADSIKKYASNPLLK